MEFAVQGPDARLRAILLANVYQGVPADLIEGLGGQVGIVALGLEGMPE